MNTSRASKSQIFLLEFVFVVLFFAICTTVCVMAFVKSDRLSNENAAKNEAIVRVESAAEVVKACAEGADPMKSAGLALEKELGAVDEGLVEAGKPGSPAALYSLFYNEDFAQVSDASDAAYTLQVFMQTAGDMLSAEVSMGESTKEKPLFALDVKKYVPLAGSGGEHE